MFSFKKSIYLFIFLLIVIAVVLGIRLRSNRQDANSPGTNVLSQQVRSLENEVRDLKEMLEQERKKTKSLTGTHRESAKNNIAGAEKVLSEPIAVTDSENLELLRSENAELLKANEELLSLQDSKKQLAVTNSVEGETAAYVSDGSVLVNDWYLQTSPVKKIEFLESLTDLSLERDPTVLPILLQAINDYDPEVSIAASKMLSEYRTPEVLPVIEAALLSSNEQVRLNALEPLGEINDIVVSDLLALAYTDSFEDVRTKALDITGMMEEGDIQLKALSSGIGSTNEDVKTEILSILEFRGDRDSVSIVIEGLKDPSPEFREEVNSVLSFMIDQEFSSYNEAVKWWDSNKNRYDEDLFEK